MKGYIFETFASCSQVKLARFCGILTHHFQTGKRKRSDRTNEAYWTCRHLYIREVNVDNVNSDNQNE